MTGSGQLLTDWADSDWAGLQDCHHSTSGHSKGDALGVHVPMNLVLNPTTPTLYSNSSGAYVMANDPQHFKRTKHINIAYFFLQDKIADGCPTIAPIQSSKNLTDILTKPLAAPTLSHL
ncbi:uncharacterized protein UBRO_21004 [Ustilago bromivora]|uniref:Uncharacterized protein n=1 Tax=Ustilago bromivora TaxID=307758 RepID=A0A1K0H9C8_9BASI|nr:uncharacterized protein UBRO_21004 [Ustilago bromivora]